MAGYQFRGLKQMESTLKVDSISSGYALTRVGSQVPSRHTRPGAGTHAKKPAHVPRGQHLCPKASKYAQRPADADSQFDSLSLITNSSSTFLAPENLSRTKSTY